MSPIDVLIYLFDAYTMLIVSKYFVCVIFQGKSLIIPEFNEFGYQTFFYPFFLERSCSLLDGNIIITITRFLTKLLTEDLPRLFVRPKKIVLDFQQGRAMGPVSGSVASDIIQNVASDIIQDGNKDFVGELSVTLVDARKLSFVLFGKRTLLCK